MVSEDFIEDIKVFFDSIRNIGICAALTLGLPAIESSMPMVNSGVWLKLYATLFAVLVIVGLYVLNLVWLFSKLKSSPFPRLFHFLCISLVMFLITLAISSTAFYNVWDQLFNYL